MKLYRRSIPWVINPALFFIICCWNIMAVWVKHTRGRGMMRLPSTVFNPVYKWQKKRSYFRVNFTHHQFVNLCAICPVAVEVHVYRCMLSEKQRELGLQRLNPRCSNMNVRPWQSTASFICFIHRVSCCKQENPIHKHKRPTAYLPVGHICSPSFAFAQYTKSACCCAINIYGVFYKCRHMTRMKRDKV